MTMTVSLPSVRAAARRLIIPNGADGHNVADTYVRKFGSMSAPVRRLFTQGRAKRSRGGSYGWPSVPRDATVLISDQCLAYMEGNADDERHR